MVNRTIGVNDKVIPLQYHPLTLINYTSKQRGVSVTRLLAGSGVNFHDLAEPDTLISYGQYAAIVQNALEATQDPFLGLAFGKELQVHTHGVIGLTVLSQPTVEDAVKLAIQYKKIVSPITSLVYENHGDVVRVAVHEELGLKSLQRFFTDTLYSSFMVGYKTLTNDETAPIAFYYKDTCLPGSESIYQSYLGNKVFFSQPSYKMESPSHFFERKMLISNNTVAIALEEQLRDVFKKVSNYKGVVGAIRGILINRDGDSFPSLENSASLMNTSVSTLKRKLKEYNTSYQKILDDVRMELAAEYLRNTDKSVKEIGYDLGYKEPPIFSRAFKKWFSMTPLEYREKHQS